MTQLLDTKFAKHRTDNGQKETGNTFSVSCGCQNELCYTELWIDSQKRKDLFKHHLF